MIIGNSYIEFRNKGEILMGILKDIRNKLKAGSTRAQLIEEGYASSSAQEKSA